jgi:hypothetical protein
LFLLRVLTIGMQMLSRAHLIHDALLPEHSKDISNLLRKSHVEHIISNALENDLAEVSPLLVTG